MNLKGGMPKNQTGQSVSCLLVVLMVLVTSAARSQSPVVSYLIPDIGTPGMNTYVEIIGPDSVNGNFGFEALYANNSDDEVQVVCANPSDNSKVTIGPVVVSWGGKMIATQFFVHPSVSVMTTDWKLGINIPIKVIVKGHASNI